MPITPLHLGVLAPINYFFPNKVSNVSFILVNVWIDLDSILYGVFGIGDYSHDYQSHSFLSALVLAFIICLIKPKTMSWYLGAILGGISHIILDMFVHSDMHPFYPIEGNIFYFRLMELISFVLLPLFIWFIAQSVSYGLGYVRKN